MPKNNNLKRGPEGTLQRRVFVLLKTVSGCAALLADMMDENRMSVHRALAYLWERGHVIKHPFYINRRVAVLFSAVPGKMPPSDRRGVSKNSRNCRGAKAFARWLVMMRKKHGPTWVYRPKGQLETLWTSPTLRR